MSENTMWAFIIMCIATVLLGIIAAVGYNYHENNLIKERMITKHGIDPVILECSDGGFKQNGAAAIFCWEAMKKYKINDRDITKLRKIIGD